MAHSRAHTSAKAADIVKTVAIKQTSDNASSYAAYGAVPT